MCPLVQRQSFVASERGKPRIMQTLPAESIKRFSFSHGNGIWLQNTLLLIGIKDLGAVRVI